jgi:carbon-monoxide dehydrogenase small subunit
VHVNGNAVKACTMLAAEAEGAEVLTIEGVANADGSLNKVQQAFQDHHGLQCGFCTPGMVMTATALLKENPNPTEAEIRDYLEGNICRCTGYHNIVKSIMAAAGQDVSRIAAE